MEIAIPKDAIEILSSQLTSIIKAVSEKKERGVDALPPDIVELVKLSQDYVRNGKPEEAVHVMNRVVSKHPEYARGRLQLVFLQQKTGNDTMALFTAGNAFSLATDKNTRSQILSLAGSSAMSLFKRYKDKSQLPNSVVFFERAIDEDDSNANAVWNLIEVYCAIGENRADDVKFLVGKLASSKRLHKDRNKGQLTKILSDWEEVLGNLYCQEKQQIENIVQSIIVTEASTNRDTKSNLTRRTLVAASVAASLVFVATAGNFAKNYLDSGPSIVIEKTHSEDEKIKEIKKSSLSTSEIENLEVLQAGVEYDMEELTIQMKASGVDFDFDDLA